MKFLFTAEFYNPYAGGIQEVARQVMERLVKKGHSVTLATSFLPERNFSELNGVKIESFRVRGNEVTGLSGEVDKYRGFLLDFKGDAMLNLAINCWSTDIALQLLPRLKLKAILSTPGFSTLYNPRYQNYYASLAPRLANYHKLVFTSANYQDKIWADQQGLGQKSSVIPNGAAAEEFLQEPNFSFKKKFGITAKTLCISVSTHYRGKGHAFVIEAFKRMKRPNAQLAIIGNLPPGLSKYRGCFGYCWLMSKLRPNIILVPGSDRQSVLAAYREADIFLFGSKLECAPLVLYESFASKTYFISTPVGNVPDYKDIVSIVKTPQDMAKEANFVLDRPEIQKVKTDQAFSLWQSKYTWDKIAEQYERILVDSK